MKFLALILIGMAMSFQTATKKKVVFFGDSITQAGVQPTGYVTKVGEMATKDKKGDQYEFIGAGIGGNKVYDLYLRLEDDVLSKNPDIVVIYIGVNDVWHKQSSGTGTDYDKFEKFYNALLKKFSDKNIKVVLATPAVIGERTDNTNQLDGDLNRYSNLIRSIAAKNNLPLVDLRKGFLDYNKQNNPENKEQGILTTDRVHLNEKGNEFVAAEMWKAIQVVK
ncbi:MAG TPA: SGNH/GDSL hydrolase family protein [Cyclobacteriaceae bacterium]|nr:SGNH/GDSL hydrolase family protein [Cyclobacteriaceae bacterium]